jgi:hypothetical protein
MLMKKVPMMLFAAAGLCGCAGGDDAQTKQTAMNAAAPAATEEASAMSNDCPVIDSRGWSAWLDTMPSLEPGPRLHIYGEVDLPTPGYTVEWREGPADRANPPGQRMTLILTPPDGMVAQVVTPTPVKYQAKATYPAYRAIYVICGGKPLAEINDVPTVS